GAEPHSDRNLLQQRSAARRRDRPFGRIQRQRKLITASWHVGGPHPAKTGAGWVFVFSIITYATEIIGRVRHSVSPRPTISEPAAVLSRSPSACGGRQTFYREHEQGWTDR